MKCIFITIMHLNRFLAQVSIARGDVDRGIGIGIARRGGRGKDDPDQAMSLGGVTEFSGRSRAEALRAAMSAMTAERTGERPVWVAWYAPKLNRVS